MECAKKLQGVLNIDCLIYPIKFYHNIKEDEWIQNSIHLTHS